MSWLGCGIAFPAGTIGTSARGEGAVLIGREEQVLELDEEWEKRGSMKRSRRQATGGISILPRKSRDETATKIFSTLTDGCGYSFVAALLVRTVF